MRKRSKLEWAIKNKIIQEFHEKRKKTEDVLKLNSNKKKFNKISDDGFNNIYMKKKVKKKGKLI